MPQSVVRYPLRRSPVLWIGLSGLLFLLWAWQDSTRYYTTVGGPLAGIHASFRSDCSALRVITEPPIPFLGPDWTITREETSPSFIALHDHLRSKGLYISPAFEASLGECTELFPAPFFSRNETIDGKPEEGHIGVLPYWLVVAVYTPAWAALLAWRWRRVVRPEIPSP